MVTIAPAGAGDIGVVQSLADHVWRSHYPGIISTAQIDYMLEQGYAREALLRYVEAAGAGLALARIDDEPVAFVAWRQSGSGAMNLEKLYVAPAHHGKGVGRALIEHVADAARRSGCRELTLNVNRNNESSIRAYEHCGFAIRERGDFPIGNGFVMEDYIMVRALAP
ncbi:MAG TPA: GNAT family N-acetyltransferase [Casimicrobiaceae bacterium]|jgi:GNAT superfamily N-acetyltransferase|nr:GNAT family N-acetyltransferase [Casimicrobiaceae bacterium]